MKCPAPLFKIYDKFTKVIPQKQNFSKQKGRVYLLLSTFLLILSFPKFNLFPLAWVALIPLFLAIENSSPKSAFILGFLTGFLAYLGLLYWIVTTITTAGESLFLGILCLILLSAYLALYFGFFTLCFRLFTIHYPLPTINLFSAFLWVSLEYLRSHLFTGFPWALLGYTQWNFLPVIQISEFTGVYGVSFLIVLVNTTLFRLWEAGSGKWREKIRIVLPTLTVFLFCLVYGFLVLSPHTTHQSPLTTNHSPLMVVLLQGNIDQYKKWSKEYEKEIMDTYENLIKQTTRLSIPNPQSPNHRITQSPSLIIWPESAIPGYLLYERHLYEQVKKIIQQSNCYHLIGSVHYKKDKLYNSVFLFSPEGKLLAEYDKIHPVPFGETIPLKDFLSKYIKVLNELGDFSSGKDFTVFNLPLTTRHSPLTKFGVNICFEAIFPHLVRNFVKNGAEIIVNLTNDAWFLQTSAPYQHFTMNIFRAVENRRYVVRSANTGISAFIDPYGRVIKQTPIFITADLSEQIYPQKKMTFYTLYGDLFVWLGLGITLVFLANLLYIKKEVKNDVKRMGRKK